MKVHKNDSRGMTLVELMAAMAVALILMLFLTRIFVYSGNMFEKAASVDDLERTTQAVFDFLERRLSCAASLEVTGEARNDAKGAHEIVFSKNGRIYYDGKPLYEEAFYRGRSVYCMVLPADKEGTAQALSYRITWKNQENTALYSAESVVKLVNLELAGREIVFQEEILESESSGQELYFYYEEPEY